MTKRVSAAQAKARFPALVASVAFAGERYVIERHGKPLAALVSLAELERLEDEDQGDQAGSLGALALIGAWSNVADATIDAMIAEIYAQREHDTGRPVDLEA